MCQQVSMTAADAAYDDDDDGDDDVQIGVSC